MLSRWRVTWRHGHRTTRPDQILSACRNLVRNYGLWRDVCLFIGPLLDVTLQQVWLLIAEEEKVRAEAGNGSMHDVTASAFLLLGMDIEGLQ